MVRLFVALDIPNKSREGLSHVQLGLRGAKWRGIETFHITLAFIGETDRHGFREAHDALAAISAPAFELKIRGLGYFGDRKPRAVWAGVESTPPLLHLQEKVSTALRRKTFDIESRKFAPHITLAYLKGAQREDVEHFCAVNGGFSIEPFTVAAFHLYSSRLGGDSAHYEIEESYSLSFSR